MADGHTQDRARRPAAGGGETYRPDAAEAREPRSGAPRPGAPAGDAGSTARSEAADDRSLGQLVRELGDEGTRLVREEVALAKAEMREKVQVYERNAAKMAVGGALLLGALLALLVAVNRGLTALLAQFMSLEVAVWLAPLILAGVIALIGWSLVKGGQKAIRREGVMPHAAVETVRAETQWAKQEAREVRHGGR